MQDQINCWNISTAITTVAATPKIAVQYVASSTNTAEVLYFKISQSGSITSAMDKVGLIVPAAAATVTAGITTPGATATVVDLAGGSSTLRTTLSTSATGVVGTTASTVNGVYHSMDFNVLAGYEWNAQPNTRVWVPVSGIVAVYCYAVVALTYNVELVIRESK
jgi:hypothetical protein